MIASAGSAAPTGQIDAEVYDGTRRLFPTTTQVLYYLHDGSQKLIFSDYASPTVRFPTLPFHDNLFDNYTVVATIGGHGTSGYTPVAISPHMTPTVRLMLTPNNPKFDFSNASWGMLQNNEHQLWNLLAGYAADPVNGNTQAQAKYQNLLANSQPLGACLLNILTAMKQIQLGGNKTPVDFIRDIDWDYNMAQDRFYCWADEKLIDAILEAGKLFAEEPKPSIFHGGTATRSWKEADLAEANVQFTFHEKVLHPTQPTWVRLEPDIDYYKDLAAHFLGEVVVNWFGSLTDPVQVYKLRWIGGSRPGSVPFEPPYVIV